MVAKGERYDVGGKEVRKKCFGEYMENVVGEKVNPTKIPIKLMKSPSIFMCRAFDINRQDKQLSYNTRASFYLLAASRDRAPAREE